MFCPNCGNDCGEAKFCSSCGSGTKKSFPNESFHKKDSFEIPKRKCVGVGGYITLGEKTFCVRNTAIFFSKEVQIPYQAVTEVLYVRPKHMPFSKGILLIRWQENRNLSIPTGYARYHDKTAVTFLHKQDSVFYHIFCLLRTLASPAAQFYMDASAVSITESDMELLNMDSNLDEYFERYNPYRVEAAMALYRSLHGRIGANTLVATEVIGHVFDLRQRELYESKPSIAIRDLNRVITQAVLNRYI